jgi:Flp pilus assembly protein TadB
MDLVASACVSLAVISLALAVLGRSTEGPIKKLVDRQIAWQSLRLEQARIARRPHTLLLMTVLVPAALFLLGWIESPVLAILGAACGFLAPRVYLTWLVRVQARRSEEQAPRLLQVILSSLSSGSTYLDALRQARQAISDCWIREDLEVVIQRFLLNVPLHESMRSIRARISTPNLGLVWEALIICSSNQLPTPAARTLLYELSATVQFNVQLEQEVRAKTSGQRLQIWLLAAIVPGMYLYLRLISPELLSTLDQTVMGRYVLVPTAAALEVLGVYLSLRLSRFSA